jgi:hypothetical protein
VDCISVNILVAILYCNFAKCYYCGKLIKVCKGSLHTLLYNCMWTCNIIISVNERKRKWKMMNKLRLNIEDTANKALLCHAAQFQSHKPSCPQGWGSFRQQVAPIWVRSVFQPWIGARHHMKLLCQLGHLSSVGTLPFIPLLLAATYSASLHLHLFVLM